MQRLCALHPPLTALVLVLKQLLHERGLNDPYKGGLGAYGLTIMAAAVCQRHALEPPSLKPSLGTLLVNFLSLYGTKGLNPRIHAVALSNYRLELDQSDSLSTLSNTPGDLSLYPRGAYSSHVAAAVNSPLIPVHAAGTFPIRPRAGSAGFWAPAPPVIIIDPLNPGNNVGRSCFGFQQVQLCFDDALATINAEFEKGKLGHMNQHESEKSILGSIFGASHHKHVVNLSASVWCPFEQKSAKTTIQTNELRTGCSSMTHFEVSSLTDAEQKELRNLMGSATPLSGPQLQRVRYLMRQTALRNKERSRERTVQGAKGDIDTDGEICELLTTAPTKKDKSKEYLQSLIVEKIKFADRIVLVDILKLLGNVPFERSSEKN